MFAALPPRLDVAHILRQPPEPFDFVLPGLVRGAVGALVSPGGVGKSFWTLCASLAVSSPTGVAAAGFAPVHGRVVFFSMEDSEQVVSHRLHDISTGVAASDGDWANLDYRCCVGMPFDLMSDNWLDSVIEVAEGARLVVFDTLRRCHTLDENSSADMTHLLGRLERVAQLSGAAVVFIHHTNKASVSAGVVGQGAARGSSVLVDNARWVSHLTPLNPPETAALALAGPGPYVRWHVSKQNYGKPVEAVIYRRNADGVFLATKLQNKETVSAVPLTKAPAALPPADIFPQLSSPAEATPAPGVLPSAKGAFDGKW